VVPDPQLRHVRSLSPAHQGDDAREVLAGLQVAQFVGDRGVGSFLKPGDSLATILDRFDRSATPVLPVVDSENHLLGAVVLDEVHLAARATSAGTWLLAADLMRSDVRPLRLDDRLDRGMELFAANDLPALPVVDQTNHPRVVGVVRRSELATAYIRKLHGQPKAGLFPDDD
jgi:CBS-domain-containing membrane protein